MLLAQRARFTTVAAVMLRQYQSEQPPSLVGEVLNQYQDVADIGKGKTMSARYWLSAIASLCLLSNAAMAEGRCPPSMFETGSRDYIACAPIPGYDQDDSGEGPPSKSMIWERRWGAIAREVGGGALAGVNGFKSEAAAKQAAIAQCRATGTVSKDACKVTLPYYNQCAAFAWGEGWGGAVSAADLPKAKEEALKDCNAKAGSACEIFYTGCSLDESAATRHGTATAPVDWHSRRPLWHAELSKRDAVIGKRSRRCGGARASAVRDRRKDIRSSVLLEYHVDHGVVPEVGLEPTRF